MSALVDRFGREITYLRVSVTDMCNMRCVYCIPPDVKFLPAGEILTLEEIARVVRVGVEHGIRKVRLTGGEPLARKNLVKLVQDLAQISRLEDLSLTTNGLLLEEFAEPLKQAGLHRVNVSLDTLHADRFKKICRMGELWKVLNGVRAAIRVGLKPVKINVVVMRGANDDELEDFAKFSLENDVVVRFIEYMPVKRDDEWREKYMPRQLIMHRIKDYLLNTNEVLSNRHEPARYFTMRDGISLIGIINPVSHGFCSQCNRLRLTPVGGLRGCLLSEDSVDVKLVMRNGGDDSLVARAFQYAVAQKGEKGDFKLMESSMNKLGG